MLQKHYTQYNNCINFITTICFAFRPKLIFHSVQYFQREHSNKFNKETIESRIYSNLNMLNLTSYRVLLSHLGIVSPRSWPTLVKLWQNFPFCVRKINEIRWKYLVKSEEAVLQSLAVSDLTNKFLRQYTLMNKVGLLTKPTSEFPFRSVHVLSREYAACFGGVLRVFY